MTDLISNLAIGLNGALSIQNLLFCLAGVLLGTLVGILPGLGPVATIALLLPLTFDLSPLGSLIMLAGVYYGAQYGGSTTAILVNLPGEASSVITTLDGHAMTKQGRAGTALAAAAIGSFVAGTIATFLIAAFAPPLARLAFVFGPPEYFSLMILGLLSSVLLASGSLLKAISMLLLGILFGLAGLHIQTGIARFNFGLPSLREGYDLVAVAMGLFAVAEILRNLESKENRTLVVKRASNLLLSRAEMKALIAPVLRGTAIGSVLGILPGGGAMLSSFAAYALEKKVARNPEEFGKGALAGVAAPESANNAGAQMSFIPMLTLGIPSNPVMALMIGALIIQGITPGPNVVTNRPDLFWGLIVSMWIGNLILVLLNLPLIGVFVRLLTVPYRYLYPAIIGICCIGAYAVTNSSVNVYVMAGFGLLGYILIRLECELAPFILGFVLGPLLESHLLRSLIISSGDLTFFVSRPVSAGLLAVSAVLVGAMLLPAVSKKREVVFRE